MTLFPRWTTRTEKVILDNLNAERAGKTTILIAHRISTVERMDKIIFIDDGRVVDVGSHDALYGPLRGLPQDGGPAAPGRRAGRWQP